MEKPDIQTLIERAAEDVDAQNLLGINHDPDDKWFKKIKPGVQAAQRAIDGWWDVEQKLGGLRLPPAPPREAPAPDENTTATPEPAPQGAVFERPDLVAALRERVRVAPGAGADEVIAAVLEGKWARKAIMLVPLALPILPWVHFAHMAHLRTHPWVGYNQETDTLIQRARNRLAAAFLKSEAEWSFWVDGDIVPPFGNEAFFFDVRMLGIDPQRMPPEYARLDALTRLQSHGKTIVGAVYQQRRVKGKICNQIDLHPQSEDDRRLAQEIRNKGPQDKLAEVKWCATGCLLVHRKVYEDIAAKYPERAPQNAAEPFDYFGHEVGRGGEDAAFCTMAAAAGHKSYLDLAVWAAHVGNISFVP